MKDVSYLRIEAYSEHPEVLEMADMLIESYLSTKARKNPQKYIRPARKLIASLWLRDGDMFRFSTKTSHFGEDKRKQVWMTQPVLTLFKHMRETGLVNEALPAIPPEMAQDGIGRSAIYARSQRFRETLKSLQPADILPDPDLPRVMLRDASNFWVKIDPTTEQTAWFQESVEALDAHSHLLSKAHISLSDGSPMHPNTWLYIRKFKESFEHTGRLYAPFTTWKKEKRLGITFEGIKACSLDLSQLHPTLILRTQHGLEKEYGLFTGLNVDPYDMPDFFLLPRAVHKTLINACFNAKSMNSAARALTNAHWRWDAEDNEYDCTIFKGRRKREGHKCFPGNRQEAIKYIESFKSRHPQLADAVCSGVGLKLQKLDSDYMINVIRIANEIQVPVLPVHDEVVFPENQLEIMKYVFARAFSWTFGDAGSSGSLAVKVTDSEMVENRLELNLTHQTKR